MESCYVSAADIFAGLVNRSTEYPSQPELIPLNRQQMNSNNIILTIAHFVSDPPWNGGFFVEEDILLLAATSKSFALTSCRRRICKGQSPLPQVLSQRKIRVKLLSRGLCYKALPCAHAAYTQSCISYRRVYYAP